VASTWASLRARATPEWCLRVARVALLAALGLAGALAAAASVATAGAVTLLLAVAPTARIFAQPLHFDFTAPSPAAHVDFRASLRARHLVPHLQSGTRCVAESLGDGAGEDRRPGPVGRLAALPWLGGGSPSRAPAGCAGPGADAALAGLRPMPPGQRFNVDVELVIPDHAGNWALFQVEGVLGDGAGNPLAASSRPAMVPYRSPLVLWTRRALAWPWSAAGLAGEAQRLTVRLFDDVVDGAAAAATLQVRLRPRHGGPAGAPEVASARAVVTKRLGWVGRALYHLRPSWPVAASTYLLCLGGLSWGAALLAATYLLAAAPVPAARAAPPGPDPAARGGAGSASTPSGGSEGGGSLRSVSTSGDGGPGGPGPRGGGARVRSEDVWGGPGARGAVSETGESLSLWAAAMGSRGQSGREVPPAPGAAARRATPPVSPVKLAGAGSDAALAEVALGAGGAGEEREGAGGAGGAREGAGAGAGGGDDASVAMFTAASGSEGAPEPLASVPPPSPVWNVSDTDVSDDEGAPGARVVRGGAAPGPSAGGVRHRARRLI